MRATTIITTIVIFIIFVTGFTSFIYETSKSYETDLSGDGSQENLETLEELKKINQSYSFITESSEALSGSPEEGTQDENVEFKDALSSSFTVMFGSLRIIPSLIANTSSALNVPPWMSFAFIAIVVFILVIAVVSLIIGALGKNIFG